jgi:hypothetical protein
LQPSLVEALEREDLAGAADLAYGAMEALAHELRPAWAEDMAPDEALMQAMVIEIEHCPLVALEDNTLRELQGTAVWVTHRAWCTTPSEALAATEQLARAPGVADTGTHTVEVSGRDGRATIWTRVWA